MRWGSFSWLVVLCGLVHAVSGQDLFDYSHSVRFANYLYESRRYSEAQRELERVVFLRPSDTTSWVRLIRSLQQLGQFHRSVDAVARAEEALNASLTTLGRLKIYGYLKSGHQETARGLIGNYDFADTEQRFLQLSTYALSDDWSAVKAGIWEEQPPQMLRDLKRMSETWKTEPHKSPLLAGLMSGIVPGTGKIYTGRWKDGLFSLLLLGTSGWQAYRIISRKGIENPGAWFFGGMAVGFYTGNVYGSVKSARQFNDNIKTRYRDETTVLLDLYMAAD